MLRVKLYYPQFLALKPRLDPATILYTEAQEVVAPFSVWGSLPGDHLRVFVCFDDRKPASFHEDFPEAMEVAAVAA